MFVGERRRGFLLRGTYRLLAVVLLFSLAVVGISFSQESTRKVIARTAPGYPELAKKIVGSSDIERGTILIPDLAREGGAR